MPRSVEHIHAVLLLVAIAVAASVLLYTSVSRLASSIEPPCIPLFRVEAVDAYVVENATYVAVYARNVGECSVETRRLQEMGVVVTLYDVYGDVVAVNESAAILGPRVWSPGTLVVIDASFPVELRGGSRVYLATPAGYLVRVTMGERSVEARLDLSDVKEVWMRVTKIIPDQWGNVYPSLLETRAVRVDVSRSFEVLPNRAYGFEVLVRPRLDGIGFHLRFENRWSWYAPGLETIAWFGGIGSSVELNVYPDRVGCTVYFGFGFRPSNGLLYRSQLVDIDGYSGRPLLIRYYMRIVEDSVTRYESPSATYYIHMGLAEFTLEVRLGEETLCYMSEPILIYAIFDASKPYYVESVLTMGSLGSSTAWAGREDIGYSIHHVYIYDVTGESVVCKGWSCDGLCVGYHGTCTTRVVEKTEERAVVFTPPWRKLWRA